MRQNTIQENENQINQTSDRSYSQISKQRKTYNNDPKYGTNPKEVKRNKSKIRGKKVIKEQT